jgi:ubiquinone/menaquinone biosynthesis C-methylase UbiE
MIAPTETPKARAASTYNSAADHFDDEPLAFWSRYGERTIARLALRPGSTVLDAGCGSGASAIPAAKAVGPTGRVIGVDLAEKLLNLGRTKAAKAGLGNIEFRIADMEDLDYQDGQFDAVVCVFAIFFAPDMESQAAELWRMVRPGGKLAITTWGPRLFEPGTSVWWETVREEGPDLHMAFNSWDRITDPASVRQLLSNAGVPDAEVVAEDGSQILRRPEDWWAVVLGSGYRWTVDKLGKDATARVRKANIDWARQAGIGAIETNVVYALATKK